MSAKDNYPRDGQTQSYFVGFAEVEVDVETGKFAILEFTRDCRRRHRASTRAACRARRFGGIDARHRSRHLAEVGLRPALRRAARQAVPLQQAADDSRRADRDASSRRSNLPDPETPVGARGIGEPPVGAGYGAVLNAIAAAIGDEVFRRTPVTPDMILKALEKAGSGRTRR